MSDFICGARSICIQNIPELWLCHFLHMAFIYWLFTLCILFQRLTQALPWSLEGDLVVWCYCFQQCDPMDSKLRMGQFLWQGIRTVGGRPSMCIILMRRPDLDTTIWSTFVLFVLFFDLKMTQCPLEVKCATNLQDRLFWVGHDTAANGWLEFIALWLLLDQDEEEEQHEVSELMVFAATFVLLHIAQLGLTKQFQVNVDSCCWRNQASWILCDVCGWDTILQKTLWTFGS